MILESGGDRVAAHRASLARWYGVKPDAVAHIQNTTTTYTTYMIDLTGPRP